MPRNLVIGNVHPSSTLLDRAAYPVHDDGVGAVPELLHALRHASFVRQGVVVCGRKGAGKTLGLARAVREFRKEEAIRHENDRRLPERKVVVVPPRRPSSRSEMIRLLYENEFGEVGMRVTRRGDESMLAELVESWMENGTAVVAFDEAENLPPDALTVCRDILSYSAPTAEDRLTEDSKWQRKGGLGLVLIGTDVIATRLKRTPEWGERWTRVIHVQEFTIEHLPELYASFLPAFSREAERRGPDAWARFIHNVVGPHHTGSLRLVEAHTDSYLELYCDNIDEPAQSTDEVEFVEEIFEGALLGMAAIEADEVAA